MGSQDGMDLYLEVLFVDLCIDHAVTHTFRNIGLFNPVDGS